MKPALWLSILLAAAAQAQQGQPTTVIKTETRVVQVDAVVTDKNGNLVPGLTARDFHVWEDNKEQTIQSVSLETHAGAGDAPSYTVLFFNNPTLDGPAETRLRDSAARFVAANAGPGNLMAVSEYGNSLVVTQNFTADAQRLQQVVSGTQLAGSITDTFSTSPSLTRGQPSYTTADTSNREGPRRFLLAVASLAGRLSQVPGRKTIVLFSAGMPADSSIAATMAAVVNLCNRSNVSIYPLEASGLSSSVAPAVIDKAANARSGSRAAVSSDAGSAPTDPAPTPSTSDQILHGLARGTGGYVNQNGNNLAGMLAAILKEESGYYLLNYSPPASQDGSCHTLHVKVDRGVELRARSTYCNTKALDLLAGKPIELDLEKRMAGDKPGNLTASLLAPFFYSEPGVAMLNVAVDAPSDSLKFEKVKGKLHSGANVLGVAYTSDGTAAARFSDTVHFDFASQKELDAFHSHPLHYEKQLHIAPGEYTFKVVLAAGAESFARLQTPLRIDPYTGAEFMLSALALSKETHPASELGTAVDEQLLENRTPLVFHDIRVVPAGNNNFARSNPLFIYLEIYDAPANSQPEFEVLLRVLDRQSGEQRLTATATATAAAGDTRSVPYALRFKLDSLSPAWYTAEIKVTDAAERTMTRTADFQVHE